MRLLAILLPLVSGYKSSAWVDTDGFAHSLERSTFALAPARRAATARALAGHYPQWVAARGLPLLPRGLFAAR